MIVVSGRQFEALDAAVDDVGAVAGWLARRWPKPFAALSSRQRLAMAAAAVGRARAWGVRSRAGCFVFAGYMAEFAADFDRHPKIAAELKSGSVDSALSDLPRRLGEGVWSEVRRAGSTIGWRLDALLWDQPPLARIPIAVRNASGRGFAAESSAQAAVRAATGFAPSGGDHGLFVLGLAALMDGPDTAQRRFQDDLRETGAPYLAVAMSALRLTLDHDIWV